MKHRLVTSLIFCGVMGVAHSALAEWVKIGETEGNVTVYIDPSTVKKTELFRRAWFLYDMTIPQDGKWRSITALQEFDCVEDKMRSLSVIRFSDERGKGKADKEFSSLAWSYGPPGTIKAEQIKLVCEL